MKTTRQLVKNIIYYYDECFLCNFYFCIGWKEEDFTRYMKEYFNHDVKNISNARGKCFFTETKNSKTTIIWTRHKRGKDFYETLAHECIHAAIESLENKDIFINHDNDEILTYLVGCLMRKGMS